MDLWLSHPFEIAFDLWTLLFSVLICLFLLHQRKALKRNNILFFFWFMFNIVFIVLKLEAYRNPELMAIMKGVNYTYVIANVALLLVLAASIHRGFRPAFSLQLQEWLYVAVNAIGILFLLITGTSILERLLSGEADAQTLLISLIGFAPTVFAAVVDMTYLRPYHMRLRNSSPHMIYVFMIAVFIAALIFSVFKGTGYSAGVLTVAMLFSLFFYLTLLRRPKEARAQEKQLPETAGGETLLAPSVQNDFVSTGEFSLVPVSEEASRVPEAEVIEAVKPHRMMGLSEGVSLLDLNPQFVFNTLNAVYYLTDQDAAKAKSTVEDLSAYLKAKSDAAKIDHMIPVEGELEAVRRYVSVMELRYDDVLHVSYDLQNTGFLLPPLTILTLVEFAVEAVVKQARDTGEVRIASTRDNLCNRVSVAYSVPVGDHVDKAALFEQAPELQTVKNRLESFCRGAMEILPESDRVVLVAYLPLKTEAVNDDD